MASKKRMVTYYFSDEMLSLIKTCAGKDNRSNTNFVETAVLEYIERNWPGSVGTQPGRELTAKASKEPGE